MIASSHLPLEERRKEGTGQKKEVDRCLSQQTSSLQGEFRQLGLECAPVYP